jgi:hypothetical protein
MLCAAYHVISWPAILGKRFLRQHAQHTLNYCNSLHVPMAITPSSIPLYKLSIAGVEANCKYLGANGLSTFTAHQNK